MGEVSAKKKKHSQLKYEENEACGLGCFSNQWFCDTFKLEYVLHVVIRECNNICQMKMKQIPSFRFRGNKTHFTSCLKPSFKSFCKHDCQAQLYDPHFCQIALGVCYFETSQSRYILLI